MPVVKDVDQDMVLQQFESLLSSCGFPIDVFIFFQDIYFLCRVFAVFSWFPIFPLNGFEVSFSEGWCDLGSDHGRRHNCYDVE